MAEAVAHVQLHLGIASFLANGTMNWVGPAQALSCLAFLLIARTIVRRDRPAWAVALVAFFAVQLWTISYGQGWALTAPLAPLLFSAQAATVAMFILSRYGLLACAVHLTVFMALLDTPLTADPTRWYAWRTGVIVVVVAGLAYWGFRNVLGRQSAFSEGTLEG